MEKIKKEEKYYQDLPKMYNFASDKEKEIMLNRNFKRINDEVDAMISELLGMTPKASQHMNEFVQKLDMKTLGERLQKVRMHLKLKQSDVAKEIGCALLTISRMERGETSTSLLPLLAFYSQSVSLDVLFGKTFDPEDEALYNKNPAMESHVKARLQLLQSDATEYIKNLQKEYDVNVKKLIDELLMKMNQEMLEYTSKTREDLLRRLEQTIELL